MKFIQPGYEKHIYIIWKMVSKLLFTTILSATIFSTPAFCETSVYYEFNTIDNSTKSQLNNVKIHITTFDLKSNKEIQSECLTEGNGKCSVSTIISGGWFLGYSMNFGFKITPPEGYSTKFKYTSKKNGPDFYVTVMLVSLKEEIETLAQKEKEEQDIAKNIERERREAELRQERLAKNLLLLRKIEEEAVFVCADKKSCEKSFALTEIFIGANSNLKIQVATLNTLETFNPTKAFDISMKAYKIPTKGDSSEIRISVSCKEDPGNKYESSEICTDLLLGIYGKFHPFLSSRMQ